MSSDNSFPSKQEVAPSTSVVIDPFAGQDRAIACSENVSPPKSDRSTRHLNQIELSRRWTISPRTVERWRWMNEGPAYIKIGGRVAYRLDDIEAFEAKQIHQPS